MATQLPPPTLVAPVSTPGATRKLFVGHTVQDIYVRGGRHYGPGTVELPYDTDKAVEAFNDFVKCVRRVQNARAPEHRVNLDAIDTPPPKQLTQATAEELRAALAAIEGPSTNSVINANTAPATTPVGTAPIAPSAPATQQFIPSASFVPTSAAPTPPPNVPDATKS